MGILVLRAAFGRVGRQWNQRDDKSVFHCKPEEILSGTYRYIRVVF